MKTYAYTLNNMSEEEKKAFVLKCEAEFEVQLEAAAKKILEDDCRIVTLSGPTCSGKTTTASRFMSVIEQSGKKVGVISIDDFYKARNCLKKNLRKEAYQR